MLEMSEEEANLMMELRDKYIKELKEKEREILKLKFLVKLIEDYLTKSSFMKASKSSVIKAELIEEEEGRPKPEKYSEGSVELVSSTGEYLGTVNISRREIEIIPDPNMKFEVTVPPFSPFLIRKVLLGMKLMDENARVKGELKKEEVLDFKIEEQDNILKRVLIKNYRDPKRVNRIVSAARWTFDTMLKNMREKSKSMF